MKYEVLVDGKSVWTKDVKDGKDKTFEREVFPEEYRMRPGTEKQRVNLDGTIETVYALDCQSITQITDGEIIAVLRHPDAPTPEPVPIIVGQGGVTNADQVGKGG